MKQPKLKLTSEHEIDYRNGYFVDIDSKDGEYLLIGCGKSEKTMWRGAIRNLKKLLAEAEKRLEELG